MPEPINKANFYAYAVKAENSDNYSLIRSPASNKVVAVTTDQGVEERVRRFAFPWSSKRLEGFVVDITPLLASEDAYDNILVVAS